jgi:putative ABC transport system permease protein
VASLLLSRAAARRKEISLRAALGAGRGRVLRQLLTESLVLSLLGGALGVGLAAVGLHGLRRFVLAYGLGFSEVTIDASLLAFVTALSLGCGLVFGVVPAAAASRVDLGAIMKAGGPRATSPSGSRLRSSFIALEVALAVVLAVGAGLFLRTLFRLSGVDPGFRSERTLSVRVAPDPAGPCTTRSGCVALYDELLRRTAAIEGVSEVAAANALPLFGDQPLLPVEIEGHPLVDGVAPLLWAGAVTPRYLEVMGVPLLRGRTFAESDGERSEGVMLVSAATARRYWPDQDPIGKKIRVVWDQEWRTVVGVVGDVRQYALSGRGPAEVTGALYMPYSQSVALDRRIPRPLALLVRSTGEPAVLSARLRELVAVAFPDMPVGEVRSLDDLRSSAAEEPRTLSRLFAVFAGVALLLAAIGTYGVVSYTTAQRRYEIAVRLAVGATRRDILGMVIGQSLRLVIAGLAIGAVAALLLGRALQGLLYGVGAGDPLTFVAVAALLVATACLAGYLPGRRAAATDPVRALRAD